MLVSFLEEDHQNGMKWIKLSPTFSRVYISTTVFYVYRFLDLSSKFKFIHKILFDVIILILSKSQCSTFGAKQGLGLEGCVIRCWSIFWKNASVSRPANIDLYSAGLAMARIYISTLLLWHNHLLGSSHFYCQFGINTCIHETPFILRHIVPCIQ